MRLIHKQRSGRLSSLRLPGLALAQAQWLALEAARTRQRRALLYDEPLRRNEADPAVDPENWTLQRERMRGIQRELARCPARAQQVFYAVYGPEPRGHAEVAREMGLSLQRVRQILCEVRARLRSKLRWLEGEEHR
jgi:RNA polymerase sigma-70 factor (ECF subfamily)